MRIANREALRSVKHALVCVILFSMTARSSLAFPPARFSLSSQVADSPKLRAALDWLKKNLNSINEQQIKLTEIPAPPFKEEKRAAAVRALFGDLGLRVEIDKTGNVIAELPGADEKEIVVLSAHLDTVFPASTDVKVKREAGRLSAPGISDNGTGLAALVAIANAIQVSGRHWRRAVWRLS